MLRSFDALVAPDKTSLVLKRWLGSECPLMINTGHGAGDRAGGYQGLKDFDYHLLPGRKYEERMMTEGIVDSDHCAVVGYVKFDCMRNTPRPKLFSNDRPTVLYAPHFNSKLSSWYDWGEDILDYFVSSSEFNLIFAPHVLLYQRRLHISTEGGLPRRPPDIPEAAMRADNILVDPGSIASIDMTYTRAADIYIGDVSSMVYEFLIEPRPCIFFNRGKANWRDNENYRFWSTGEVLDSVGDLPAALARTQSDPMHYRTEQESAFSETFDLNDTPSSVRAADAIIGFLVSEGKLTANTESS
jgi:CDP-glycerol glycerophosphotransferase (TagB/SpsB family)